MPYETIRYEIDGPIAVITLNRPEKLNAYTARMGADLAAAFNAADADDAVRVVILTGEGQRAFCAGADLSAGASSFDTTGQGAGSRNFGEGGDTAGRDGVSFLHAMFNCRKATIAAFNGPAVGVGATLALPTDIKIASSRAKFGFVFARRGLAPEAGSAWFLPKLVGLTTALRWCIGGQMIEVDEALQCGLVTAVTEPQDLMGKAREIALDIAHNTSAISVAVTRQLLWRFSGADLPFELLKVDGPFVREMGASADVKEGVMAFLEKRPPHFPLKVSTDMPVGYPWWKDAD